MTSHKFWPPCHTWMAVVITPTTVTNHIPPSPYLYEWPLDSLISQVMPMYKKPTLLRVYKTLVWTSLQADKIVRYSDHGLNNGHYRASEYQTKWSTIQKPFKYWTFIRHLNSRPVNVHFSEISTIQMFAIHIPTVCNQLNFVLFYGFPSTRELFIHEKAMVPYVQLSTNCGLNNFINVQLLFLLF